MIEDDDLISPYPEWKRAGELFLEQGKEPGDLLDFAWFYDAFDMSPPKESASIPDYEKGQLRFLKLYKGFELWLQEEQFLALRSRPGLGYEVVKPSEQTPWAMEFLNAKVAKELKKAGRRVAFTRVETLTTQERQQQVDALARIGRLRGVLVPRQIKGPG